MTDAAADGTRPEPRWWAVYDRGMPCAAYPNRMQAEVYASGFSRQVEIVELGPAAPGGGDPRDHSQAVDVTRFGDTPNGELAEDLLAAREHTPTAIHWMLNVAAHRLAAAVPPAAAQPRERERAQAKASGACSHWWADRPSRCDVCAHCRAAPQEDDK